MSTVKIVKNKKTGLYYQPTTSGKMYKVQVSSTESGEQVDSSGNGTGMNFSRSMVGFSYHQTEQQCKDLIASAIKSTVTTVVNGVPVAEEVLTIPGKVIYVDQLTPITAEAVGYGIQYPYPMSFNGTRIEDWKTRAAIQAAAATSGVALMQSGKPIYRKKIHTTVLDSKSVILSPDNMDDVNAFIATVLEGAGNGNDTAKAVRLAELQAIPKASRTKEQKAELAELLD